MNLLDNLLAKGLVPDPLIRVGMRRLLALKEREEFADDPVRAQENIMRHVRGLMLAPVAVKTAEANAQHYEVPTEFFRLCLGTNLKYSSCYYETGHESLDEAERKMLSLTCQRARLGDSMDILELGCGWGSLSLWMAEKYPAARITAVSNSRTQKEHIDREARTRGISNLTVITQDMNVFDTTEVVPENWTSG